MSKNISVISTLLRLMNGSQKKDNNYDIANLMVKNFHRIPKMTINDLADACYVSAASISRFIRLIGFENYTDFRNACNSALDIQDTDYSSYVVKAAKEDIEPIFKRYTSNVTENLDFTLDNLDYKQFERIGEDIFKANDIAFFGLEYAFFLGQHFQVKMAQMNKLVKLGLTTEEQQEIAKTLNKNSVAIIVTLEGGFLFRNEDILNILKKNNVKVVCITMNNNIKLLKDTDEVVVCNKYNSNTEGRITLLYVLELFLMYYCINYKMINQ